MNPGALDSPVYRLDRLKRLSELEPWHFWFVGRQAMVIRLIEKHVAPGARILDIGCGTGWMSRALSCRGYRTAGLDLHPDGLRAMRAAIPGAMPVQAVAEQLPFGRGTWEAALLLDVLEHADDRRVLEELRRVLRPGGILVTSVPALPWLWSHRDEIAGHRRRYTRRQLRRLAADSGFGLREMRAYQFFLFPLVLAGRVLGRGGPELCRMEEQPPPTFNRLLARINRIEVALGEFIPWPWGSSLVAVCSRT